MRAGETVKSNIFMVKKNRMFGSDIMECGLCTRKKKQNIYISIYDMYIVYMRNVLLVLSTAWTMNTYTRVHRSDLKLWLLMLGLGKFVRWHTKMLSSQKIVEFFSSTSRIITNHIKYFTVPNANPSVWMEIIGFCSKDRAIVFIGQKWLHGIAWSKHVHHLHLDIPPFEFKAVKKLISFPFYFCLIWLI